VALAADGLGSARMRAATPSQRNSDAAPPGSGLLAQSSRESSHVRGTVLDDSASDQRGSSRHFRSVRTEKCRQYALLRKEVIQPHLPVRLPCYDFTPIADPTFDSSPPRVGPLASGVTNFRGVTGGVYKARERIHRSNADLRLLATPTSRSRVADYDPN
jgi:hypothetical protein